MKPFDESGTFTLLAKADGLAHRAAREAAVTLLSGGFGLAIQVISILILARLLTPKDFGLVTMVTTFSLLFLNLGLNGLTEAVVQAEKINHALASNLFWINVAVGLLLTIGFASAGTMLAHFYRDPLIARVAVGISLTIVITSTSVLHLALLKRGMLFSTVSINELLARQISVAVSIVLAFAGCGYWALVGGAIAQPLVQTIGAWSACRWVPGIPRRAPGTASMVRFAIHTYGRFGVNYTSRNMDNFLVGWRFRAVSLGFYKKAYDLFALPASQFVSPISVVAVAALSRLDPRSEKYKQYFLDILSIITFVGMGLAATLTLVGKDLIVLLLGRGWEPAGQIFTLFGPGIGVMLIYHTHGWMHLSIGRPDRWFRWSLIEVAVTGLLFLGALHWGPAGIAVAWTLSFWILTLPSFWYAGKSMNFGMAPVISAVWRYTLAAVVAAGVSALVIREVPALVLGSSWAVALARISVTALLFLTLYLGQVVFFKIGHAPIQEVLKLIRFMVRRRTASREVNTTPVPAENTLVSR